MKITVSRFLSDTDATLSSISVDGDFVCFGLEDEYREDKVMHETRIPAGEYPVTLRTVGGFHGRYSKKFSGLHKGMLWVRDVPGFEYILIHVGNTDDNTSGCLLVGEGASTSGELRVSNSVLAYEKLYSKVVDAAASGSLVIEYVDNDGVG